MKKTFTMLVCIVHIGLINQMYGQGITTAAINGTVRSTKSGAENTAIENLPGAVIVATHIPSGTQYSTAATESGRFKIFGMRIGGPYKISTSFIGYKTQIVEDVYLELGDDYEVSFKLSEESVQTEEVVVSGNKDNIMNSDRTGAGTNIRKEQFERLPTLGRSFQDFASLTPQAGSNFSFGGRNNLYNNFAIDGSTMNNMYGLQPLPGSQTSANPISVDAIQEMKVNISPYDVKQGNFTGAAINAVTRSGTNEFSGSVYGFYRNQSMNSSKVEGVNVTNGDNQYYNRGFRLGGPIIKNKLFFFVNVEQEAKTRPGSYYTAQTDANPYISATATPSISTVKAADLDNLRNFLISKYGYDPGQYQGFTINATNSNKILGKLDWNINKVHKLTVRFNSLLSYADVPPSTSGSPGNNPPPSGAGRGEANANYMPFSNSFYTIHNNSYSVIAELNSNFGSKFSNTLQAGYTAFRDYRTSNSSPFPMVDFINPTTGNNYTSVGYEPFTYKNTLNQDVFQINDNFNYYLKNHVFSLGTTNEIYKIYNYFYSQYYGTYQYFGAASPYNTSQGGSIQQFIDNTTSAVAGASSNKYVIQYVPPGASAAVNVTAATFGFYAQDEYSGFKNLKVTAGLRVDIPTYFTTLPSNPRVDSLTYSDGTKVSVSSLPSATPLLSPRLGFNWDVKGDKTLQVRGGTGIFTGRIPLVWAGNQGNTNGITLANSQVVPTTFSPTDYQSYANQTTSVTPASITIAVLDKNFKWPQVWRTSIGIDKKLPWGLIGTLEGIFTQDLNAIQMVNVNLKDPIGTTAEGRDLYDNGNNKYYYPFEKQVLVLKNTGKGYSWSVTGQLQKSFSKGFYASLAYTYTDSRDLNTTFSTASSGWTGNLMVGNPNNSQLAYSSFLTPHRIVAQASYKLEYLKHFATTFSMVYIGNSGLPFSYIVGGDPINSGNNGQQLMYIPKSKDDIILTQTSTSDTRSADEIWRELDAYISQDSYLNSHRGEFAARNGAFRPWINTLNLRILQDIFTNIGSSPATPEEKGYSYKGKRNSLQISLEIQNVLNLLNSSWGVIQTTYTGGNSIQLLNFVGYEHPAVVDGSGNTITPSSGKPIYTFGASASSHPTTTFINDVSLNSSNTSLSSRYQIQIGLRYTFN